MPLSADEWLVRDRAVRAERAELAALETRAFAREAALAALVLCTVGLVGLTVSTIGGYDLMVRYGEPTLMRGTGVWMVRKPMHDFTGVFAGLAAAGFAASMVTTGVTLGRITRFPAGAAWSIVIAGATSALGLLLVVLQA